MLSKNRIKDIQSLCQKRERDKEKMFIAEGDKTVVEILLQQQYRIASIFATEKWALANASILEQQPITVIENWELEKISALQQPNQVLALVHYPEIPSLPDPQKEWVLVLDGIQDPGNLGTILRTCDWFGVPHIVCSNSTVDLYNSKVIQATMGSFLRVKVHYTDLGNYLENNRVANSYAAVLKGKTAFPPPVANGLLMIGSEGKGLQYDMLQYASHQITIPSKGKAESLNAAVATGILLAALTL